MAKNVFKQFVGTITQATVIVGGVAIGIGAVVVPGGIKHLVHHVPLVVKEIEEWKEK